jgi:hypothetical protein
MTPLSDQYTTERRARLAKWQRPGRRSRTHTSTRIGWGRTCAGCGEAVWRRLYWRHDAWHEYSPEPRLMAVLPSIWTCWSCYLHGEARDEDTSHGPHTQEEGT